MPFHKYRKHTKVFSSLLIIFSFLILYSCNGGGSEEKERSKVIGEIYKPDTLSLLIKYESSLFPLPSPYQASHLVKKHDIPFFDNIPNDPEKANRYSTTFKKALNLGIYGTDLSYLNIYNRTPSSISYLKAVKKLAEEINLTPAFNANFFANVEKNIDTHDSLMVLLGKTYRKADSYLRENNRTEIGALIITGGWVESLYILTQIGSSTSNRDIINRIGEQKHPLDNLIEILSPMYYQAPEYSELIDKLIDLAYEFDGIIYSYSYNEPKVEVENKIIHINSESRVTISEYHLDIIKKKVEEIRNIIVE